MAKQTMTAMQQLAEFIKIVDAFNALEAAGVSMDREGECGSASDVLWHGFLTGPYSIEWDSVTTRWTLVAETDTAIEVCPFNHTADECREVDKCEDCLQGEK